jgi:hypothetical protein
MHHIYLVLCFSLLVLATNNSSAQCGTGRYYDKLFSEIQFTPNIDYGGMRKNLESGYRHLLLDLYEPKHDEEPLRPLVVLIHGGAFLDFPIIDKRSPDILNMAQDLVQRGYVVASPEYRLVKNPLALLSLDFMAREVVVSMLDVNDALCYFVETYHNGNPHRIDIERMFVGGVSAGAIISLHGLFIDRVDELSSPYVAAANFVAQLDNVDVQAKLDNKYCGAKILGGVSISGALIDTSIIKYRETAIFFSHGTDDNLVPHDIARPFGLITLPDMYGPGTIVPMIANTGTRVEFESWEGSWHVPFLAFDWPKILQLDFEGFLIDRPKFDVTMNRIALLFQDLLGCPTPVRDNISATLKVYPNPNSGTMYIDLPVGMQRERMLVQAINTLGQVVYSTSFATGLDRILLEELPQGQHYIRVQAESGSGQVFTGKVVVR